MTPQEWPTPEAWVVASGDVVTAYGSLLRALSAVHMAAALYGRESALTASFAGGESVRVPPEVVRAWAGVRE